MKWHLAIFFIGLFSCFGISVNLIYPNSKTVTNFKELGVEGLDRICSSGLWYLWILGRFTMIKKPNLSFG